MARRNRWPSTSKAVLPQRMSHNTHPQLQKSPIPLDVWAHDRHLKKKHAKFTLICIYYSFPTHELFTHELFILWITCPHKHLLPHKIVQWYNFHTLQFTAKDCYTKNAFHFYTFTDWSNVNNKLSLQTMTNFYITNTHWRHFD